MWAINVGYMRSFFESHQEELSQALAVCEIFSQLLG
jgi:hypothetical protein